MIQSTNLSSKTQKVYEGFRYRLFLQPKDIDGVNSLVQTLIQSNVTPYFYGQVFESGGDDQNSIKYPKIELLGIVPMRGLERRFKEFEEYCENSKIPGVWAYFGNRDFKVTRIPEPQKDPHIKRFSLQPQLSILERIPGLQSPKPIDLTLASENASLELVLK